jgi:tetratricopeptide (TPR) repeat protein
MTEPVEMLLGHFGGRFVLKEAYAGGEGQTLRVTETVGGATADRVLKVLTAGAEPQEAALLLSLQHPAIPAIREVGRLPDGRAFVVRDHEAGRAFTVLPADRQELLAIVQELLEVLAYVHLRSVVHLDLKPQNLLRDEHGRLHLLDFGLGARRGEHGRGGTLFFAAPELLLGGIPDARADLFSVGAMVAQALWPGGRLPLQRFLARFPSEDFFAAAGVRADDFPAPFGQFLSRCLSRRPARRFQDAQEALEFLCGGSGRPQPSLLAPDPAELFGPELAVAGTAEASQDLLLCGGDAEDRRALAMHLVAMTQGAQALREAGRELRVVRGGGQPFRIDLPELDPVRLQPHLLNVLGLQGQAAIAAAAWLVRRGARSGALVREQLLALVRTGEVVPSGSRWSWPAAFSGRLSRDGAEARELPATPANVRLVAAQGHRERAIGLWREGARTNASLEPRLRDALAEGLLDAGEPAQALPFCTQSPLLRAMALLDMGQVEAARREMELVEVTDATGRLRLGSLQARVHLVRGEHDAALQNLQHAQATPRERLLLATACNLRGDAARSEQLLAGLLEELAADQQPFLRASVFLELGHVHRRRGDLAAAERAFTAAAELLFELGHVRHAAKRAAEPRRGREGPRRTCAGRRARLREARTLFTHVGDAIGQAPSPPPASASPRWRAATRRRRAPGCMAAAPALQRLGNQAAARLAQVMLARVHAELGDRHEAAGAGSRCSASPAPIRLRSEIAGRARSAVPPCRCEPARRRRADRTESRFPNPPMNDRQIRSQPRTVPHLPGRQSPAGAGDPARQGDAAPARRGRHAQRRAARLPARRARRRHAARVPERRPRPGRPGVQPLVGAPRDAAAAHADRRRRARRSRSAGHAVDPQPAGALGDLRAVPFSAGGTVGAIYVEHPGRAGAFTRFADKEALEVLADQAAIAVDRMLREEALAERAERRAAASSRSPSARPRGASRRSCSATAP